MFISKFFVLVTFVTCVFATQNINEQFDKVLDNAMAKFGRQLDPYHISDKRTSFERKLIFVTWRGEVKLHNIILDGLANIQRDGDAVLNKNSTGVTLNATLKLPVLFFHADSVVQFMGLGPKVQHYGQLDETRINATIYYNPKIETISLIKFDLKEMRNIRLKIDGPLLMTDALTNIVVSSVTRFFTRTTRFLVQTVLKRALNSVVTESEVLKHIMTEVN